MPSTPRTRETRSRSPASSRSPPQRPFKRQRRSWGTVVEELALANGVEEDAHRVAQRQKQIDYGKNTIAYDRFSALWPRENRARGHPMTPLARQKCSKRSFAGQVTSWKKKVYDFVAKLDLAEAGQIDVEQKAIANGISTIAASSAEGTKKETSTKEENVAKKDAPIKKVPLCTNDTGLEDWDVPSDMDDMQLDDQGNIVLSGPGREGFVSQEKTKEVEREEDEEDFSDMEDIELDDMGNLITSAKTPPPSQGDDCAEKSKIENSPPSIFDVY